MLPTTWSPVDGPDIQLDPDVPFDPDVQLGTTFADPLAGPGGDAMFTAVPALMGLIAVVAVVMVAVHLARAGQTFAANASSPERTVAARVVGKRTQTEGGGADSPVRTLYFSTFEAADGERVEVKVPRHEYGQLVEGDQGQLTHQGTWYRGFDRRRVIPVDGTWEAPGGPSLPPPSTT